MLEGKLVIGITQGDTNGVGYDVMLRTLQGSKLVNEHILVLYGSGRALAYYRKLLGLGYLHLNQVQDASEAKLGRLNVVDCVGEDGHVTLGAATQRAGRHAIVSLESFFADWEKGLVDALVTLPINKQTMLAEGFAYAGHTDYIAHMTGAPDEALMLMVSPKLRVALVTTHVPLCQVSKVITQELVEKRIRQLHTTLRNDFAITNPRIAVMGLNPHASEGEVLGSEDANVVQPAVENCVSEGIIAVGPLPSDGFFGSVGWLRYDAVLAMYHDQGLIPFKLLAFNEGVNYTAGLSLVRTSPAHGTAYQLAGKGTADCGSFRHALFVAIDVLRTRMRQAEIMANALPQDPVTADSNPS